MALMKYSLASTVLISFTLAVSPGARAAQDDAARDAAADERRAKASDELRMIGLINQRQIARGMTQDHVRRAWGEPTDRFIDTRGDGAYGSREQWIYETAARNKRVYFDNGIVTNFTDELSR